MWISKKKYQELLNKVDNIEYEIKKTSMQTEFVIGDRTVTLEGLIFKYKNDVKTINDNLKGLIDMLNNIINITFEGNRGFETVVFQPYGKAPEIFYKGKKLNINKSDEVDITMINGKSLIETTKVHA